MQTLPTIWPMLASEGREPFDDPEWLFEIKHDGFRALAYLREGRCHLRSRRGHGFDQFRTLEASIAAALAGQEVILDGEIVCLDAQGRSVFADLLHRRGAPYFYAFDLLWLNGQDLRRQPLLERKQALARLVASKHERLLYVDHLVGQGRGLYTAACEWDLEGIVAKRVRSQYVVRRTRCWLKIKNPDYSQQHGRKELFERVHCGPGAPAGR